jgi:hypothetical protein
MIVYELNTIIMLPFKIIFYMAYLYWLVGYHFIFGFSLLFVTFYITNRIRDECMFEFQFEIAKIQEKKSNLTNETFENIRSIKLYGWDSYFHKEILNLMNQED